jgi:hypothetical protein
MTILIKIALLLVGVTAAALLLRALAARSNTQIHRINRK